MSVPGAESGSCATVGTAGEARCAQCILPCAAQGLQFSAAGVCRICEASNGAANPGEQRTAGDIEALIERIRQRGRGGRYDCLVGLSGGRDSSFLLHELVRRHALRCVAAYYRTPFTPDTIDRNVRRLTRILGVPLVEMRISQEGHRHYARQVLDLWRRKPSPALINLLCVPCKAVNREVFHVARRYGARTIVYGGNPYENFQLGVTYVATRAGAHRHALFNQLNRSVQILKRGTRLAIGNVDLLPLVPQGFVAALAYINPHTPYLRLCYRDIVRLDYFNHTRYDEQECIRVITNELGWELPPGAHSYWRADCSMAELKNLMFKQLVGASYVDTYLSNLVRAGEISRDEALRRLAIEGTPSPQRLAHVSATLGVQVHRLMPLVN